MNTDDTYMNSPDTAGPEAATGLDMSPAVTAVLEDESDSLIRDLETDVSDTANLDLLNASPLPDRHPKHLSSLAPGEEISWRI